MEGDKVVVVKLKSVGNQENQTIAENELEQSKEMKEIPYEEFIKNKIVRPVVSDVNEIQEELSSTDEELEARPDYEVNDATNYASNDKKMTEVDAINEEEAPVTNEVNADGHRRALVKKKNNESITYENDHLKINGKHYQNMTMLYRCSYTTMVPPDILSMEVPQEPSLDVRETQHETDSRAVARNLKQGVRKLLRAKRAAKKCGVGSQKRTDGRTDGPAPPRPKKGRTD
uniref:Uncharacterized protein n=1 Tax=Amphimedon queenslandica TaxID=400682 RepID=A0A1X7TFC3_AMPQE